jgi:hypothetical protein
MHDERKSFEGRDIVISTACRWASKRKKRTEIGGMQLLRTKRRSSKDNFKIVLKEVKDL